MACEYCRWDGPKRLCETDSWGDGVSAFIHMKCLDGPCLSLTALYDCGYVSGGRDVQINYCPMCGRKLIREEL